LDSESESIILEAMLQLAKNHTSIVIAHRLSTVVDADNIIFLEQGRVLEQGTHQELLAANGRYAQMWAMQLQNEKEWGKVGQPL
jgi:ATP-binding cassette, subfamily B, heavy metal transporter